MIILCCGKKITIKHMQWKEREGKELSHSSNVREDSRLFMLAFFNGYPILEHVI